MDPTYLAEHCGTRTIGHSPHGVVADSGFCYIANSDWDAMDEHGKQKLGASMSEALLMGADLKRNRL